jgi:hypothetical protein
VVLTLFPPTLLAQYRSAQLLTDARLHIADSQWDSADAELRAALESAPYLMDSCWAYAWRGILEYQRGSIALARLNFRRAFTLHPEPGISGLDSLSPGLARLFDSQYRAIRTFSSNDVDEPARWREGPAFVYPPELRARRIEGHALLRVAVDTLGHVDPRSIEVIETPDSGFIEPLTQMMVATAFHPARIKGRPVRSLLAYQFNLALSNRKNPTQLVEVARGDLRANRPDSALARLQEALDPDNGATPALRMYAQLLQGIAWHAKGRDSLSTTSFHIALAQYRQLSARGVDFAPFLRALADSVRLTTQRE